MERLDEIGLRHGTDKASRGHGYLDFYQRFFEPLRDQRIQLLEIGVFEGRSLAMWRDFFPQASIIGVDINPAASNYEDGRVQVEIIDASDAAEVTALAARSGPFDIIVDDASHYWSHQIASLQYLLAFVKPGGFYVIEDIDTSFGRYLETHRRGASVSAFEYVHKLCRYVTAGSVLDLSTEDDAFLRSFAPRIEFIACHEATVLICTKSVFNKGDLHGPPALIGVTEKDLAVAPCRVTTHLGEYGDVLCVDSLSGGLRGASRYRVQGFSIEALDGPVLHLQYRALLSTGEWTDWSAPGTFVGTRAQGLALKGIAVRAQPGSGMECVCAASFVDEVEAVMALDSQECVSPSGADMEAFQIALRKA